MKASWWLKLERAVEHMVDLEREVSAYVDGKPFEFERVPKPMMDRDIYYRLRFTSQPDPRISIILGDSIHNLRSAIDHVFVACLPPKRRSKLVSFPCAYADPWARDAEGQFMVDDPKIRDDFESTCRGLDKRARAIVESAQPYQAGAKTDAWVLGLVNRLDNADKHRRLNVLSTGVRDPYFRLREQHSTDVFQVAQYLPRLDDAVTEGAVIGGRMPVEFAQTKVEVEEYGGTAIVTVEVPFDGDTASYVLPSIVKSAATDVADVLLKLEPFAR